MQFSKNKDVLGVAGAMDGVKRPKNILNFSNYERFFFMVGLNGLEPSTSRLSGVRSNQLSYKPPFYMVEIRRFELLTPCLQGRCSPS